ncbi:MAG: hypothetical protein ACRDGH_16600, partial [Candidatus Limnocylindria bacterium]
MAPFSRQQSRPAPSAAAPTIPAARQAPAEDPRPASRGHLGWIVTASAAAGFLALVPLVAAPFIPVEESPITGAVLCGFAVGWAV